MPKSQTKFGAQWLEQVDGNGHLLRLWCRADAKDIFAGYCILCFKRIPCASMGIKQILQHAAGDKHRDIARVRFSKVEKHLVPIGVEMSASTSSGTATESSQRTPAPSKGSIAAPVMLVPKSHLDKVTTAEVLWALKIIEDDNSFSACDHVGDLFRGMFPDSSTARDFHCGSSKMSYLVTHGLSPYFEELLLKDLNASHAFYTLHYDETTTAQVKKQMDLVVRYWSSERNGVVVHYLGSVFLGHAQASIVSTKLLDIIAEKKMPLNNLLSLSFDGPNVNKAIEAQINKALTDSRLPPLVDIGSCNLHKVHNAFGKGLASFGKDAEDVTLKLFYWFKHSAARREDFKGVQFQLDLDDFVLLRHVPSRWL